jgi:hypothetical protein
MAAIRHVRIENFRGFGNFQSAIPTHAVLVGEPGSGRSDLIEALIRTLDPDVLSRRHGSDLDLHGLNQAQPAIIEISIGDLTDGVRNALFNHLEYWDRQTESVVTSLRAGVTPDPDRYEQIVRFAYRLAFEEGQPTEVIYYPKFADPARSSFPRVSREERSVIPFFWQRGMNTRPLDLAGRGELRSLIDRETGEDFTDAADRFMKAVEAAAASFSSQERVAAALQAILTPLRPVRRFEDARPGADLVRFLPDGGAPSGLLRSLAAAVTLRDSPEHFPALRQGSTALAALRGGALHAAADAVEGAIVAIDDFGGEFDPFLARHLAGELRRSASQLVIATHTPAVTSVFATEEIVRLYWNAGSRQVARVGRPTSRQDRISARYLTSSLVEAFNASVVVVVEGHHDRMGYAALIERAVTARRLLPLDAAGITFVEAQGQGETAKVARAARALGIFAIALLDNDKGTPAATDAEVQACLAAASGVVRLPSGMAIEQLILQGVSDAELVRVFTELGRAFGDLALPSDWTKVTGPALARVLAGTLHNRPGSLHASYLWELSDNELPGSAIAALDQIRTVAVARQTGLTEL